MLYGFRVILLFCLVAVFVPFGLIAGILAPRNPRWNHVFIRPFSRLALPILGLHAEIEGLEHLELNEPSIIIANHQHRFDIALLMYLLPKRCVILAKKSVLMIPITGWLFWLWGNVAVQRRNSKNRYIAMKALANVIKKRRASLWIFPEGSRYQQANLQTFRDGAFELALQNNRPIVPIVIAPYASTVQQSEWISANIKVIILPAVQVSEFESADALKQHCYKKMNLEFTK
jgi:1-acyl-sn-glycerol-3-phosphate acyltransferase